MISNILSNKMHAGVAFLFAASLLVCTANLTHAQGVQISSIQKISDTQGGFAGTLHDSDYFGSGVSPLGDLDGDGVIDIAVAAYYDDDGGWNRGALWILFLNADGTVKAHQKISDTAGGFAGRLSNGDLFGWPVSIGDLDGDGVTDLAVSANQDDDGGDRHGALFILFLNSDGTVKANQKISDTAGGFKGDLDWTDQFGLPIANLGDVDGDGVTDIAVGAGGDDDGGTRINHNTGAIWILFMNTDGTVKAHQKISATHGGLVGALDFQDSFGTEADGLGDFDGDGINDLVAGAPGDDDGGFNHGAVWILLLNSDGTVKARHKISDTTGGFTGTLKDRDAWGKVVNVGDLNDDGITDLAVASNGDDDGGLDRGAVWILYLNADGTVKAHQKISSTAGGFEGRLEDGVAFRSPRIVGDLDGNGVADLAVGSAFDSDGGQYRGAVWILFLEKATDVVDQSQFRWDTDESTRHTVAQTFTVGIPGILTKIEVPLRHHQCHVDFDVEVTIVKTVDGRPTGSILATTTISRDAIPWSPEFVTADLSDFDLRVSVGDVLGMVLRSETTGGCDYAWPGDSNGNYDGGLTFITPDFIPRGSWDMPFKTYIRFADVVADTTPPACDLLAINPGPPVDIDVLIRDAESGVRTIRFVKVKNASIEVPEGSGLFFNAGDAVYFEPPKTDAFMLDGIKLDASRGSTVIIKVTDDAGNMTQCDPVAVEVSAEVPIDYSLSANYPNPFNPKTSIEFGVPEGSHVRLAVFDVIGREVAVLRDEYTASGTYTVTWDATDSKGRVLPSGLYFYRLEAGNFAATRSMSFLK